MSCRRLSCPVHNPLDLAGRLRALRTARQVQAMIDRAHIQWAHNLLIEDA